MRATPVALTIFPLTLVGMMAAERFALLSLGASPDSPAAWNIWLNLHGTSGRLWQAFEAVLGGSVAAHLLALVIAAVVVFLAANSRRWPTYSFLTNHAALIAAIAMAILGSQARVSSIAMEFPWPGHWAMPWVYQFSSVQLLMLAGGVASCLLCHVAFLLNAHARSAPVSLQVRMLQQNL
jgi:hypothetical protein